MASVKLLLRKDKINKKGEHPLYIRITHHRKSKYISLKEAIKIEQWDEVNKRVKRNHPYSTRLNNFIAQKMAEANEIAFKMEKQPEALRRTEIDEVLKDKEKVDFIVYFQQYLDTLDKKGKVGSFRKGKSILKKLTAYWPKSYLPFETITVTFLKQYEAHLRDVYNNKPNTIHADMKLIRKVYQNALDEELVEDLKNPFRKYKLKWTKTKKEYLNEEELQRIEELELPEGSPIFHHRNIFVFSSYAAGLRISDILQLRWENFDGERLTIKVQKTNEVLSIKIPKKGIQILNHYSQEDNESRAFIFPLLKIDPEESDPKRIYNAISSANAFTNKNLKTIASLAEIPIHLSFHSARHTWATRALRKGMRIEYVSKLMGHADIKTTQVYAKIVNSELDKAMEIFD